MANPQRIGLYLTDDNIFLADSSPKNLQKIISSSITTSLASSENAPEYSDSTQEIHIVSTFQRLLRENKMEAVSVCVSIPIKDVFLRSFVLPWMPESELNNVVYFEAKKYVPFDLKLLDYVYQAVPFLENKQKRLRVIFYAVRKQTIEKYDRIFKQTGCKPVVYESSLFSLAKYLISKNLLRVDQKTVVIYTHKDYGQIIFYEKGIAYFVREFTLSVPEAHDPNAVSEILRAQLIREIRKSLGYYHRQFSQDKINEVLVLADSAATSDNELVKALSEEFSVKARIAEPVVTSGLQKIMGMEVMCASGVAFTKAPAWFSKLNFLLSKSKAPDTSAKSMLGSQLAPLLNWEINDFSYAIQAFVVCSLLLGGAFIYGKINLQHMQKQTDELTQQQGELANKKIEEVRDIISRNNAKLESYKLLLKDQESLALILVELTKMLPEGAWLDDFNMRYASNRFYIDLKGYIYSPNGAQFKSANEFLARLKSNQYFSTIKFKLNTVQKMNIKDQEVVFFSITGS